ncbi:MAG: NAD+ synthase, partial [Elusimicrobiaceae bacterium]
MKIALAQINTTVGNIDGNVRKILASVKAASERGAELVVFPEATLTGYPALDLWNDKGFIDANLKALDALRAKIGETAVLVGYIDYNKNKTGNRLLNCAAFIHKGKILRRQAKTLLPTYDVFDEARYFAPAEENKPVKFKNLHIGITICEDVWTESKLTARQLYKKNPVRELMSLNPDLMINMSASPFHLNKAELRDELIRGHAKKYRIPFIYCNQVGGNDELVFDGGSIVFDAAGRRIAQGRQFEEDLVLVDYPFTGRAVLAEKKTEAEQAARAISLGIGDFVRKCGRDSVILGLSGGIDSAVVAALAADALGPENVIGVSLPTRYTSGMSRTDASALAKNLGLKRFYEIPIDDMFDRFLTALSGPFAGLKNDCTEENLQARIRGTLLMAMSNKFGALLMATGNKSEFAVGYSTLYGDMNGALAPLGDTPKTM